jgi:hypothetical protein
VRAAGLGFFIGDAALGAAVGEAWLVGLELKLFGTNGADFNGERHFLFMIKRSRGRRKVARAVEKAGLFVR